jgi:hypothetical protein
MPYPPRASLSPPFRPHPRFVIIVIFFAAFAIGGTGNPDVEFNMLTTYALLLGDFDQVTTQ